MSGPNLTTETGGLLFQGADYDINAAVAADVDAAVEAATGLCLVGVAIRESGGPAAVATFQIVHGATVAGGDAVIPIELAADESKMLWFGPDGIKMPDGISIDRVAGTADVTLLTKTVT